jgi:Tfp pilus assembly protein PilZ
MTNNRQHVRYDFDQQLEITHEETRQPGQSVNISRGGIFVETTPAPPFGARLVLHLTLPGVPDVCEIPCVVRWSKEGAGVGLQFEQLRPIEIWSLNKLLRQLEG